MFSYDEDDMVEDPNLINHLAHFGINITQMEKVIKLIIKCNLILCLENKIKEKRHHLYNGK